MTKTEHKYFIVTRKFLPSGKEYKIEYTANSHKEVQGIEAEHLDELNKFDKAYETIKIDGPFTESADDYLILFKNKEIKAFLDISKRNIDRMVEKLEKRGEGVDQILIGKMSNEIESEVLRIAKETATQTKKKTEEVCDHILEQSLLINDKLLKTRQGLTTASINKIFMAVFEISKVFEAEVLSHVSKAADELERQAELARKVVLKNENRWAEKTYEEGSSRLKLIIIKRMLEDRTATSKIAQSNKVAAGKLKEIAEKAIASIHSTIQVLIDSELGGNIQTGSF